MTAAGRIWRAWEDFWFRPESPLPLAAARMVIAGQALWILLSRDFAALSDLPPAFWRGVPEVTRWRYLLFPGHGRLEAWLQGLAVAALISVIVGLYPRFMALLSALILYHLTPLEALFWTAEPFQRGFEVSILCLVTLSLAPCGDALAPRSPSPGLPSARYRWPLKLIQLFVAQVYLFAGFSKLVRAGPEWVSGVNLRNWLLVMSEQEQIARFTWLGRWVADHPLLCLLGAVAATSLDLAFVLAVFWARVRRLLVFLAALFHVLNYFMMNIAFLNTPHLLVFVDWDRLRTRLRGGPS